MNVLVSFLFFLSGDQNRRCMMGSVGSGGAFVRLSLERERSGNESACCLGAVGHHSQQGLAPQAQMKRKETPERP